MTSSAGSEHFDGLLEPDDRSPEGFAQIGGIRAVLVNPNAGRLVLTGDPTAFHDCDKRGCGSVEHKIAEFDVDGGLFYQDADGETADNKNTGNERDGGDAR